MGRSGKPTIRILIIGNPGVGKNCLESRFTTTAYPPLYDPALTLSSRRFFTLSPRPPSPDGPVTRPLDTSDGQIPQLPPLRQSTEEDSFFTLEHRPGSAESTYSNPASLHGNDGGRKNSYHRPTRLERQQQQRGWQLVRENGIPASSTPPEREISRVISASSYSQDREDCTREETARQGETGAGMEEEEPKEEPCVDCVREASTYLVEVTNYPSLQLPKVRAQVYKEGEYDAVLLVYDVANRASFEAVTDLHAEIPLHKRRNSNSNGNSNNNAGGRNGVTNGVGQLHKRKGSQSALGRRRSSIWLGGGSVSTTSLAEAIMGGGGSGQMRNNSGGETVVALVGNKADVDADYGGGDLGFDDAILLEEKRGVLQEADIEERSLVHPLYRESRVFGNTSPTTTTGPENGTTLEGDDRLLRLLPGARDSGSLSPLLPPKSPYGVGHPRGPDRRQPRASRAPVPAYARRSVMSVDHEMGAQRMSVLSRRSVTSVQEGNEKALPRMPTRVPKADSIEKWIRTGSPTVGDRTTTITVDESVGVMETEESTRADTLDSGATTASKRQVSKIEGQLLSRSLLLNVPFYETSAKTGENVEEVFEAIVREVLREMGKEVEQAEYEKCKKKKHEQKKLEAKKKKVAAYWFDERRDDGWPRVELPERRRPDESLHTRMALDTAVAVERAVEESGTDESPVSTTRSQKGRRESMMTRFRRMFMRKSAVMVADVPG